MENHWKKKEDRNYLEYYIKFPVLKGINIKLYIPAVIRNAKEPLHQADGLKHI